jgi:glycosyltransferase involved in cell wall biosynthesis
MKKVIMERSKVKIAHIAHSLGGVDIYLRLILANLDSDKFTNMVIHGTADTLQPFLDSKGDHVKEYKTSILRNISFLNDFKAIVDTYRFLKKNRPDVIHAHSAKGGVVGKIVGQLLGIRVLYTPHAFSYLSAENQLKRKIFLIIERILSNGNSILLATSKSEKDRAINEVGYKPEQTIVFNNCIEPITLISPLSIKKTWPEQYICTVGRPSYQKNIESMIKVLYEVKKTQTIHLVIMGVGPVSGQLESVRNCIRELDMVKDVTLLDWTERTDVFNIINNAKFYVSTSRYEGMPYAVIESLALSKPCVVSNCDGNRDLIMDGYNGFVIDERDTNGFKQRISKLLDEKELLAELSKNANQSYFENYNIKKNISELEAIYDKYIAI